MYALIVHLVCRGRVGDLADDLGGRRRRDGTCVATYFDVGVRGKSIASDGNLGTAVERAS